MAMKSNRSSCSPKVDMIIDLQFGSTGKGLIAGFLAKRAKYDTVVTANMPNAGHTFIDEHGRKWIHKVLPNGIVSPGLKRVMIGPGAVFDLGQLTKEMVNSADLLANAEIIIHECACVLHERHREKEHQTLSKISSTMQGSMAAMVEKLSRVPGTDILAGDAEHRIRERLPEFNIRIVDNSDWTKAIRSSQYILAEGAQGFSLGINSGFWPYCTSRDCTPARFLADMAIPHDLPLRVIGTARTYPIRVGNTSDGHSGGCYADQKETSWAELGVPEERTTVTNRVRRVFTFSAEQIQQAIDAAAPDVVFLNFCNYVSDPYDLLAIIDTIEACGPPVTYRGWGPQEDNVSVATPMGVWEDGA